MGIRIPFCYNRLKVCNVCLKLCNVSVLQGYLDKLLLISVESDPVDHRMYVIIGDDEHRAGWVSGVCCEFDTLDFPKNLQSKYLLSPLFFFNIKIDAKFSENSHFPSIIFNIYYSSA